MNPLNPVTLVEKLEKLNASQQSIETLSQWCIFFRKDAQQIVTLWDREFQRAKDVDKMLALVYLANDILQNSRKKGPQFVTEFYTRLPPGMHKLVKAGGPNVQNKLARMIKVWDERRVFGNSGVKVFTDLVGVAPPPASPAAAPSPQPPASRAGRKRGNVVLQGIDPNMNSLSASMQEADEAHSRSETLLSQTSAVLRAEESQGNGADQIKASIKRLQIQTVALENEIGHRDRVMRILEDLLSQQRQMKDDAETQLGQHRSSLEQRQQKLAIQTSQQGKVNGVHQRNEAPMNSEVGPPPPPPPLPAKQTVTSPVYKNDPRQRAASSHAVSNDPRQRSAANLGPEATVQPPQNIQAPAPPPGPPPQVPDKANSQNPEEIELTADIEHVNGRGAENEHSAANLAAQLTQTGMSTQMLLDALAALPNDGPQPGLAENYLALDKEDEYDPELGA